jgi:hypothetical protein
MDKFLDALKSLSDANKEILDIKKTIKDIEVELAGAADPATIQFFNSQLKAAQAFLKAYQAEATDYLSESLKLDPTKTKQLVDTALNSNEKVLKEIMDKVADAQSNIEKLKTQALTATSSQKVILEDLALKEQQKIVDLLNLSQASVNRPKQTLNQQFTENVANQQAFVSELKAEVPILKSLISDYQKELATGGKTADEYKASLGKLTQAKERLADVTAALPSPMNAVKGALANAQAAIGGLTGSFMHLGFVQFQFQMGVSAVTGTFNQMAGAAINLQQQLLTLQGVYASLNRISIDGTELTGAREKIQALVVPMEKAVTQIRQIALEISGATSQQLIDVFRVVAQNASVAKISLSDSVELTRGFAAAMTTANIPLIQANQEIGSILQGQITQNSALAQQLGLNNAVIAQEKAKGTLAQFLNTRFAEAIEIQKQHSRTWIGVTSNIQDYFELIQVALGKPMLEPMIQQLLKILDILKKTQPQAEAIATNVAGVFVRIGTSIKDMIENNFDAIQNIGRIISATFSGVADAINIGLIGVNVFVTGLAKISLITGILNSDLIKISVTTGIIYALLQKMNFEAMLGNARALIAGIKVDLLFLVPQLTAIAAQTKAILLENAAVAIPRLIAGLGSILTTAVSLNVALGAIAATLALVYYNADKLDKKQFGQGMVSSAQIAYTSFDSALQRQNKELEKRNKLVKDRDGLEKESKAYKDLSVQIDASNNRLGEYAKQTTEAAATAKTAADALTPIVSDEDNEKSRAAKAVQDSINKALEKNKDIATTGIRASLIGGIGDASALKVRQGLEQFKLEQGVNIEQSAAQILGTVNNAFAGGGMSFKGAYDAVNSILDSQRAQVETRLKALSELQKLLDENLKSYLASMKANNDQFLLSVRMGRNAEKELADIENDIREISEENRGKGVTAGFQAITKTLEFERESYEKRLENLRVFYERRQKLLDGENKKEINRLIEQENEIKKKLKAGMERNASFKLDPNEIVSLQNQINPLTNEIFRNNQRFQQLTSEYAANEKAAFQSPANLIRKSQIEAEQSRIQDRNIALSAQINSINEQLDKARGKGAILSQEEGNKLVEQLKETQRLRAEAETGFLERKKRDKDANDAQIKEEENKRIQAEFKADEDRYNLARQRLELQTSKSNLIIQGAEKLLQRDILQLRKDGFESEVKLKFQQNGIEENLLAERLKVLNNSIEQERTILSKRRFMSAEEREKAQLAISQKVLEVSELQNKQLEIQIQKAAILNEINKIQPLEQQSQMLGLINKLLEAQNSLKLASLQLETAIADVSIKASERKSAQLKEGQGILRELGGEARKEQFEGDKQGNQGTIDAEKKRVALERLSEIGISAGMTERQIAMQIYDQEMKTLELKARRFEMEEKANKAKLEYELRSKDIAAQQEVLQAKIALAKAEGTKDERQIALAQAQLNLATEGLGIVKEQGIVQRDLSKIQTEAAREQFNFEQGTAAYKLNQSAPDQMVFGARTSNRVYAGRVNAPEGFLGSPKDAADVLFRGQKLTRTVDGKEVVNEAVAGLRQDTDTALELINNSRINSTTNQVAKLKSEVMLTTTQFERLKGSIESFPSLNISPVLSRFTGGFTPKSVPTLVNEQGQEAWTDLSSGKTQLFPFGARIVSLPNDSWVHNAQQTAQITNMTNPMAMVVDELRALKQSLLSESRNLVLNFANDPRPDLTAYRVAREMLR